MIYTITFNPAVDLVLQVPEVQLGALNRSVGESYVAGGKGINMSVLLRRLGTDSIATGFLGGFSGQFIREALQAEGIANYFVPVDGITRINVKLKSTTETELNAGGPTITRDNMNALCRYFEQQVTADDVVFLAGNKAPGMTVSDYTAIAALCQRVGAKLVLDATFDLLTECLPYQPFLIKPNHHELGEIFGVTVRTESEIIHYAQKLQEQGARNILVSRGGQGSLLLTETGAVWTADIPKGTVRNSVGAGDSMLAGFMSSYLTDGDFATALQWGAASGSATAFSVGIAERSLIEELFSQITVTAYGATQ